MIERRWLEQADENGVITRIAYFDNEAAGQPVLLIHGFAEFSCTWEPVLEYLPPDFRYIRLDVKGFGYSSKNDPDRLSLFDFTRSTADFIRSLDLKDLVLIGHSMGGAISSLILNYSDVRSRVDKLVLIDSAGMFEQVPAFIETLAAMSHDNPLLRFANEDLMAYLIMQQAYASEMKISQELVGAYAEAMRLPGSRECVIAAARQFLIPNVPAFQQDLRKLRLPTLIIWGAQDRIIPMEDGEKFHDCIAGSRLEVLPECGHSPQEECPEETGRLIADFLLDAPPAPAPETSTELLPAKAAAPVVESRSLRERSMDQLRQLRDVYKLRMTRLVDRWSFGTIFLLGFIKVLQLLKKLGMRAEENGWRKATGIFLRSEYSKFVLSCFRLNYYHGSRPDNPVSARLELIHHLGEYIRNHSQLHWSASPGWFRLGRRKVWFTDVAEAFYDRTGELLWIEMHFDPGRENFQLLTRRRSRR